MKNWQQIIKHPTFRYIDHSQERLFQSKPYTALTSFAIDDVLALSVSDTLSPPTMRLWVHSNTVVLGIPDSRLPFIDEGVRLLRTRGYHVLIRNSGGLAVALDDGVLNISLVLPDAKQTSIHECYEAMFGFIRYMLHDLTNEIEAYEIIGSYCPGDYDLSINGIKFAGISQRRIKNGAAVQAYVDVEGSSKARATLIREFYDISRQRVKTKFTYPTVEYEKMGSLSALLGKKVTIEDMKERARSTLAKFSDRIISPDFSEKELTTFKTRLNQMEKRNERISEMH